MRMLPAAVMAAFPPNKTASLMVRLPATVMVVVPDWSVAVSAGVTVPGRTVATVPPPIVVV